MLHGNSLVCALDVVFRFRWVFVCFSASYLRAGAAETANLPQCQHRCVLTSYVTARLASG